MGQMWMKAIQQNTDRNEIGKPAQQQLKYVTLYSHQKGVKCIFVAGKCACKGKKKEKLLSSVCYINCAASSQDVGGLQQICQIIFCGSTEPKS